jgi:mono/diheme cytochrome c family protein
MIRVSIGLIAASALAGAAQAAPRDVTPIVARGAQVAQERCATCHAVALEAKSPNHDAPLFRVLSRLYSARDIETKLSAISEHGHFEMPALTLREDEIADVAAYIESLEGREPRPTRPGSHQRRGATAANQWITSAAKRSISSY